MSARRILAAIWDFLVGDDPRLALAAVVGTISIEMPRCFLASGLVRTASHT